MLGTLVNTGVLDSQQEVSEDKASACQVPEILSHPCTQNSVPPLDKTGGIGVGRCVGFALMEESRGKNKLVTGFECWQAD